MLLGCRSGAACAFRHDAGDTAQQSTAAVQKQPACKPQPSRPAQPTMVVGESPVVPSGSTAGRQRAAVNTSRIIQRPIPESQLADPRTYQLSQIRRRFAPKERNVDNVTILTFRLRPSDPDFPFEMDALHCSLQVPLDYPKDGELTLSVTNTPGMERGYQINIERGFDNIVASSPSSTLLAHINALDKQLESLLSMPKAETTPIKIVAHQQKPVSTASNNAPLTGSKGKTTTLPLHIAPKAESESRNDPTHFVTPVPNPTAEEIAQARKLREVEIRQLEARMGRLPQFSKSANGLSFTLPIEPRKRIDLPAALQALKLIKLIVPEDYNIAPCQLELVGVTGESVDAVKASFDLKVKQKPHVSLLNVLNYLSQNIYTMAKFVPQRNETVILSQSTPKPQDTKLESIETVPRSAPASDEPDRSHIVTIARPPEWSLGGEDESDSSDSPSEEDGESDNEHSTEKGVGEENLPRPTNVTNQERGIMVSFPHLELHGIELLELAVLNITVKCERCKDVKDVKGLQNNNNNGLHSRTDSCKKCASTWNVGR
jgi:hypothetical protein